MRTTYFRYSIFILAIGLLVNTKTVAQEVDLSNYRMRFDLKTIKQHDNTRILEASFLAANKKDRKDRVPVYDAEVKFFNVLEDEEVLLGASKTSKEGISQIIVPADHKYLTDGEGKINLKAIFEGSEGLDGEEGEISVKNLNLVLNLIELDSIKTAMVKAYTVDSLGVEIPLEDTDIIISVGGMLSKMKIGEGTIEDGEFMLEMPTDIPGDVNGEFIVYSIIEDHEEYGNVIQMKTVNWGVFNKQITNKSNTLWSEAAPIWMYIVLTILLVGVWANYLYTIINLFKIRKEGRQLPLDTLSSPKE